MSLSTRAPLGVGETVKAPLTALIASHNEARLLHDRLVELSFCEEIIVVDIASSDETRAVGEAAGARVELRPYVAIAEYVREDIARSARHDLLVVCDPDEEIPVQLAAQIAEIPATVADDVGIVVVPLVYYFAGKPLRGTVWGGISKKQLVVRRSGVVFVSEAHRPYALRCGFERSEIAFDGGNAIRHHWVSSYRDFVEKHVRYARIEGGARARAGEVTGVRAVLCTPWTAFHTCFVRRRGYIDGVRGLILSVLYAAYRTASDVQLIRTLHAAP